MGGGEGAVDGGGGLAGEDASCECEEEMESCTVRKVEAEAAAAAAKVSMPLPGYFFSSATHMRHTPYLSTKESALCIFSGSPTDA